MQAKMQPWIWVNSQRLFLLAHDSILVLAIKCRFYASFEEVTNQHSGAIPVDMLGLHMFPLKL
jgi:hypothetical protein